MNALLESLLVPEGASWTYFHRRLDDAIPFLWHYHREIELTLTVNSRGQRYVGDNIEPYGDTDLVLLGSNLPHTWMSQGKADETQPHRAHVLWIQPEWIHALVDLLVELRPLKAMLANAGRGIAFHPETAHAVRERLERMTSLSASARLTAFIDVLGLLAHDRNHRHLCAPQADESAGEGPHERPRIDRTLAYIHAHYRHDICVKDLAGLAALSVSGLHRLFKRHTRMTVSEYIAQLRIGKACALLVSTQRPISCIAEDVGYGNLSHFNRQFLATKRMTPREFRRSHGRQPMSGPGAQAANLMVSGSVYSISRGQEEPVGP